MAPDDEKPRSSEASQEEDNPFIAFRHYADGMMAGLLRTFIGLPSASASQQNAKSLYDEEARRRLRDSWYSSAQSDEGKLGRRPEATRDGGIKLDADSGRHAIPIKLRKQLQSDGTDARAHAMCPYRPVHESSEGQPEPYRNILPWPVNYMLSSPYSPYHLERQEQFQNRGPRWRNAFEELLDFESAAEDFEGTEPPMCTTDHFWKISSNEDEQNRIPQIAKQLREWCAYRRLIPDETLFGPLGLRQPENDGMEDELTELDLFEQYFTRQRSDEAEDVPTAEKPAKAPEVAESEIQGFRNPANDAPKLGIISTLTTTERVILPDGTVHTKMMLKKRFADGREESSETVHTTQGGSQQQGQVESLLGRSLISKEASRDQLDEKSPPKAQVEKRGWFWS